MKQKLSFQISVARRKVYGVTLCAFASLFLWSACAPAAQESAEHTNAPVSSAATPTVSPTLTASPSPMASLEPSAEGAESEVPATPFSDNPVMSFCLAYHADTLEARETFSDALSANASIDALNALMDLSVMDSYLSKARLSVGRLLFDGSAYNGTVDAAMQGTGAIYGVSAPCTFTFSFTNGSLLYGTLEQARLGYFVLDSSGAFLYMIRLAKTENEWLVCVDAEDKRTVAQWGEASRFTSFACDETPYLPQVSAKPSDSNWGEPVPVATMGFIDENWYDFTWDALAEGAAQVYGYAEGNLTQTPGAGS